MMNPEVGKATTASFPRLTKQMFSKRLTLSTWKGRACHRTSFAGPRGEPPYLRLRQRRQRVYGFAFRLRHGQRCKLRSGQPFRIMALTDSLPTYSNDVHYECDFVEQLKNFAHREMW
jgi:hypothetical protein